MKKHKEFKRIRELETEIVRLRSQHARALKAERRKAKKEDAAIAQDFANGYRRIQEKSKYGETDGRLRMWAAEAIRDSILESLKETRTNG